MKVKGKIIAFFVIVLSILLIFGVLSFVLDNTGKVNQGNFRVVDMVVTSGIDVIDNSESELEKISDISFSLSQNNKISMLLSKSDNVDKIYIDNIKLKDPEKKGDIYISQSSVEGKRKIEGNMDEIILNPIDKDNGSLIEININNEYFAQNLNVPDSKNELSFDGKILNDFGINIKDIEFTISFDLKIKEKNGTTNVCKLEYTFPDPRIVTQGTVIERKNLESVNFKIQ